MESFEKNNQLSYEKKTLLTERDREVVKESLETLLHKFRDIPNEKLPTVVAFLETSTRPAVYAVKPIFKKIYKEAQLNEPKIQFLTTFRSIDKTSLGHIFTEKFFYELENGKSFEEALKEARDRSLSDGASEEMLESYTDKIIDHYLTLMEKLKTLLESSNDGPVLIFDDYIFSMASYNQIVGALKALEVPPGRVTFFAMYGWAGKEPLEKAASPDVPIWVGSDIKKDETWSGFSYRRNPEKSKYLGVAKNFPNVTEKISSEERDSEKMKELRQIFSNLGEEVSREP
ncbi:MAG: hypothetical protein NUW02_03245 [Candidatus Campbellbacteria bacterium]|nr:hypothetical protein [Candidatus Campbellbacteria bacterium]